MSFARLSTEQQQAATLLQRSLENGRLGHAYLFAGAALGPLEELAVALAKTLNCQQPVRRSPDGPAVDACGQCSRCRRVDDGNFPDLTWLRPESKSRIISVEQVRDLIQMVNLKPTEGGYKIAIIAGADRLQISAANAFLKTLEEPPSRSVLLLLTTEPHRLLETITSRCLRLTVGGERGIDPSEVEWLRDFARLAAQENPGLFERYQLLGTIMTRLQSMRAEIEKQLGADSPLERYEDADSDLREKWEAELTAAIEAEYRGRRAELLGLLQRWFRDVWLHTLPLGERELQVPPLAEASASVARRLTPRQALENLETIETLQRTLFTNVQEALAFEVGFLRFKFAA
jgi:DNA polymerase-3 subunit delta'